MLRLSIDSNTEFFNENTGEFVYVKPQTITLEHSLLSISKWEAKWKKSFLDNVSEKNQKTEEEVMDYIRCMTVTPNVDPLVYQCLTANDYAKINAYINDPMTATTFSNTGPSYSHQILTSELIYYLMISYGIPVEFEKWHINRLLTLIRICQIKNNPKQAKMSTADIHRQNQELNALRRAKYHTRG